MGSNGPGSLGLTPLLWLSLLHVSAAYDTAAGVELPKEQPWRSGGIPKVKNYDQYMSAQIRKFDRNLDKFTRADGSADSEKLRKHQEEGDLFSTKGGISRASINYVADWVTSHVPLRNKFALCHGTNFGFEMAYFRDRIPGMEVWGTELAPKTAKLANWTINWDFHVVKPEWKSRADFVYSNALDHSPDPKLAVARWMEEVAPDGVLIIEWSRFQVRGGSGLSATDLFGGTFRKLYNTLSDAAQKGNFRVQGTFNNSAMYDKHSFSYRLWHVLAHNKPVARA